MRIAGRSHRIYIPTNTLVYLWIVVFINWALFIHARRQRILFMHFQYPIMCLTSIKCKKTKSKLKTKNTLTLGRRKSSEGLFYY